jgi:uncharacterized protein (UPF0210 family)
LVVAIEKQAKQLARRARKLARTHGLYFGGIDFSLAPFPSPETSVGAALESLSGGALGSAGSLAAAAVLTDAIDRARFPRCGFSGLMLPVLEDTVLASRVAEGRLQIGELLQWSALCGTGLDTVPLPGNRLMPIPGKVAGDPVQFDFSYFTASRVLSLDRQDAPGLLTRTAELRLAPRSG